MKVLSGIYKNKKIIFTNKDKNYIKPTKSVVKKSLFDIIGKKIVNSVCLDLFCGSGSLGLEAVSRGAKRSILVDKKKSIIKTIKKFVKKNKIKNILALNLDYKIFLKKNDNKFDVIFIDAPYRMYKNIKSILNKCVFFLRKDGIIYYENFKINFKKDIVSTKFKISRFGKKGKIFFFIFKKKN
ncbi:16S rRNA (guanine(966)-N(2))-methyltransferase [Candidatus Vidania fulgoroideae]|nr:16S rRNA (guanine(966)-N(2))-methyltransferase [Candidatus Vidania fulgoroideae]